MKVMEIVILNQFILDGHYYTHFKFKNQWW
jgi:hypothetical protein